VVSWGERLTRISGEVMDVKRVGIVDLVVLSRCAFLKSTFITPEVFIRFSKIPPLLLQINDVGKYSCALWFMNY